MSQSAIAIREHDVWLCEVEKFGLNFFQIEIPIFFNII
ncbi:MAG: hypothetical protein ACI815_002149 [Psychroserpens sp.]|jgi:hypothetical protein